MLFPSGGLVRTLALGEEKLTASDEQRPARLFGDESWRPIYDRRLQGRLAGADAREEYVNLMPQPGRAARSPAFQLWRSIRFAASTLGSEVARSSSI